MDWISLKTKFCIVTGEPAKVWTGHVMARGSGGIRDDHRMAIVEIGIVAGFASNEILKQAKPINNACYGEWQTKYGAIAE